MHLKFYFQLYKSYSFHNIIDTRNKITRVKNIIVSNIYTGDIKLIHRLNSLKELDYFISSQKADELFTKLNIYEEEYFIFCFN